MDNGVSPSNEIYERCRELTTEDVEFLKVVERQIPLAADVSRADILLYGRLQADRAVVLAHAQPHSIAPVRPHLLTGKEVGEAQEPLVIRALQGGHAQWGGQHVIADGAPVIMQVYPLRQPGKPGAERVIGAFCVETNLVEHERHRQRSPAFQQALRQLHRTVQCAQLNGVEALTPFGEHDGIIVVDRGRVIRYASGVATNLYRRIGYLGGLVDRRLDELETGDADLARDAMQQRCCVEREEEIGGRYWSKKALPVLDVPPRFSLLRWLRGGGESDEPSHVILTVRDLTESRRREQELRVKTAMIQEVHHRVKNNLQTIAALLRIQARRMTDETGRLAVEEAVTRILSVAIIHEFLSDQNSRVINIKEVSSRILAQMRQGVLGPDKEICLELSGPPIYLPARQATACALVINELMQNAVEHGFKERSKGCVYVTLQDEGDSVVVRVRDDGSGLPADFHIETAESLGLQIVQTLVRGDLQGTIEMHNQSDGAEAIVKFPKAIFGGEEDWTAHA
jgi:two-component sensor histidine kinase